MRIWDIHKLSPDSADAMCSSPHLHPPAMSTTVDHRCSFNTDKRRLCQIWISTIQADATIFIAQNPAIWNAQILAIFSTFSTFRLFNMLTTFVSHHSIHLIGHQSMPVASNAPSDPPRLALTSVFLHRCRMPRCRQFPNSEEENLAWNPAPRNPLLLQATLVAHSNHGLCSFLLANGMWLLECGCWNAQCDGLQALVFLLSCSLEELCWTSIQDGWIMDG